MGGDAEVFRRECYVEDEHGAVQPLVVTFHEPAYSAHDAAYRAQANINCAWFKATVHGVGEDGAQAFFWLPVVVVSYLIGQRRFGYETYWCEKGDLDCSDFWTHRR